jgi:hypothetical protein
VTVLVQTAPPVDVVYHAAQSKTITDLRREAEASLRAGRETLIHWHINQSDSKHTTCDFYVLDWHEDDEYARYRQIVVIAPPAVA